MSASLAEFIDQHELRIVLANLSQAGFISAWWEPERIARDLWIRVDPAIQSDVVEALTAATVEAWEVMRKAARPHLRVLHDAMQFLIAGMLHDQAQEVEFAVARTESLRRVRAVPIAAEAAARYFVTRLTTELVMSGIRFQPDDARSVTMAIDLACFLAVLPDGDMPEVLEELSELNDPLRNRAIAWASHLRGVDVNNPHSVCLALRAVHDTTPFPWLDSIVVACPIERATFGSTEVPMTD